MLSPKQILDRMKQNPAQGFNLQPITRSVPVKGGPGRDPAGGTALPTGRFVFNAEGTDWWNSLVHASGYDPGKVGAAFEADEDQRLVAVRPSLGPDDGLMPVRWLADGLVSIHLGGCFAAKPGLRPESRREVHVDIGPDSTGRPSLHIYLNVALAKPQRKRKESEDDDAPPAATTNKADRGSKNNRADRKPEGQAPAPPIVVAQLPAGAAQPVAADQPADQPVAADQPDAMPAEQNAAAGE